MLLKSRLAVLKRLPVVKAMSLALSMIAVLTTPTVLADEQAAQKTLRGSSILTELSPPPEIKKWHDTEPIARHYPQQPPLIPHTTKGYVINLKFNKCLTCHSKENSGISGATPVPSTHYFNRVAETTPKVAGRRYFCVQCHVPQVDSEAFMSNDFKPAK